MVRGSDSDPDADAPQVKLREAKNSLRNALDEGIISKEEFDHIDELLRAYDEDAPSTTKPRGKSYRKKSTLATWSNRLRIAAMRCPTDLTEATAHDINRYWDDVLSGVHDDVKDEGLSQNTVSGEQSTVRKFYEYHEKFDVDKEDLTVLPPEKHTVDERDVFDGEEIDTLRRSTDNARDKALIDTFMYTGQRIRAVQTLRIKDIDLDEGIFYLNEGDGGLKDAAGKRPLLGAESSLRTWLNDFHPNPDDPEAYVFCHRPQYRKDGDGHQPLTQKSIRRILSDVVDKAGIEKPSNPHNFRHSFVTIAKRDYNMDSEDIKGIIGHQLDSRVMEETYTHLTDDDHIKAAQKAAGIRDDEEEESPLSPAFCDNCNEPLPDSAVSCSACGMDYSPSSVSAQKKVEEETREGMVKTDPDHSEEQEAIRKLNAMFDERPDVAPVVLDSIESGVANAFDDEQASADD